MHLFQLQLNQLLHFIQLKLQEQENQTRLFPWMEPQNWMDLFQFKEL